MQSFICYTSNSELHSFPDKPEPPVKEQLNYSIISMKLQA